MVDYPYPEDAGQTHYEGCWRERGHHNCAVAEAERLRGAVEDAETVIQRGVVLMTTDQLGQWEGVRTWLEMEADDE